MDKAIVPRIGAVDDDYKLPLWASSVGLRVEVVERLVAAYRDLHSVLTEAQEREIQNPELVRHLREEAEHKADRAEDLLGELEYYRIQGEVEQDEHHHHDDDDSKLVHDIGDETRFSRNQQRTSSCSTKLTEKLVTLVSYRILKQLRKISHGR